VEIMLDGKRITGWVQKADVTAAQGEAD